MKKNHILQYYSQFVTIKQACSFLIKTFWESFQSKNIFGLETTNVAPLVTGGSTTDLINS